MFNEKREGKSQENCAIAKEYLNHTAPRFAGVNCENQALVESKYHQMFSKKIFVKNSYLYFPILVI